MYMIKYISEFWGNILSLFKPTQITFTEHSTKSLSEDEIKTLNGSIEKANTSAEETLKGFENVMKQFERMVEKYDKPEIIVQCCNCKNTKTVDKNALLSAIPRCKCGGFMVVKR